MSKKSLCVRWITKDLQCIEAIRKRFKIPHITSVNGISPAEIPAEDMPMFEETAKRGFFAIILEKW